MTLKQLFSLVGALILTILIYLVIVVVYVAATFTFSSIRLSEKENTDIFIFFSLLIITAISISIAIRRFKTDRKFSAIGIGIASIIAVAGTGISGWICFDDLNYHQTFNKSQWANSSHDRFKMAKTLVKEKKLIGLTKNQVIDMLGDDGGYRVNPNYNLFTYYLNSDWYLHLYFENNKVAEAYIASPGLGI